MRRILLLSLLLIQIAKAQYVPELVYKNVKLNKFQENLIPYAYMDGKVFNELQLLDYDNTTSKNYTILTFNYINRKYVGVWVNIHPKAYIVDVISKKKYKLIRTENIPLSPQKQDVDLNKSLTFKLYFEKIPYDSYLFSFVEDRKCKSCFKINLFDVKYRLKDRIADYKFLNSAMPQLLIDSFYYSANPNSLVELMQYEKEKDPNNFSNIKIVDAEPVIDGAKRKTKYIFFNYKGYKTLIMFIQETVAFMKITFHSNKEAKEFEKRYVKYNFLRRLKGVGNYTNPLNNLQWIDLDGNDLTINNMSQNWEKINEMRKNKSISGNE